MNPSSPVSEANESSFGQLADPKHYLKIRLFSYLPLQRPRFRSPGK